MKIKSKKESVQNLRLIVPIDGLITIKNGIADVSPKCAAILLKNSNCWGAINKDKESTEETEKHENSPIIENEGGGNDTEETEEEQTEEVSRDEFLNRLNEMTIVEMKNYAKDLGLNEDEYKKIVSKKLMKAYLINAWDNIEG